MATWEQAQQNPTFFQGALKEDEGKRLPWHRHADQPHSSQVFCVSAFGTLGQLSVRDHVISDLLGPISAGTNWAVNLEATCPDLLFEDKTTQPTSIDVLLQTEQAVVCVESKFKSDATHGFGGCSQPSTNCYGYYGPGSDRKTGTNAWCRLEIWDGGRSPRLYWALGRAFFRDSVFARQSIGEKCPFSGPNYQLMRNFLFAAALAQQKECRTFGVLTIAPARTSNKLRRQVKAFRTTILQPQFGHCVQFATYERLIELLRRTRDGGAEDLANFLEGRIATLIH